MPHTNLIDLVRSHVHDVFSRLGAEAPDDTCETILIRDGFYCGRRFTCEPYRAVWFVEEQVIKFYGAQGEFLSLTATAKLTHKADVA